MKAFLITPFLYFSICLSICSAKQFESYNFHPLSYRIIDKVDAAKFVEASELLEEWNCNMDLDNPRIRAEHYFVSGYFQLYHTAQEESFTSFTNAASQYNELGMSTHNLLCEVMIVINMYIRTKWEETKKRGTELLKIIPVDQKEAIALIDQILGFSYSGADYDIEKANYYNEKALQYFKDHLNYRRLISSYGVMAVIKRETNDPSAAMNYIDSAYYYACLIENERQQAFLNIRKFNTLFSQQKSELAFQHLAIAENYFENNKTEQGQLEWVYGLYSKSYAELEKYELAFKYRLKADKLFPKIRASKSDKHINQLLVKYETEKKERQLEVQDLKIKLGEQKVRDITLLSIAGASLLSLLFYFLYSHNRNKQKKILQEKELSHQKSLLKEAIHAQDEERKRFAKDLHDGVGQQLSGIKLGLEKIERENKHAINLSNQIEQLYETSEDIRAISYSMMPKSLQTLGLIQAIADMLDKTLGNTEIKYNFEYSNFEKKLGQNIEMGSYRIIQELTNNIIKHSSATQVDLQVYKQKSNLILMLEENGTGFEVDKNRISGNGISNIFNRAEILNANINFEKNPDGMLITIKIPLN